jgi:hypothetical protein
MINSYKKSLPETITTNRDYNKQSINQTALLTKTKNYETLQAQRKNILSG